jgi:hypothetical protein
MQKTKQEWVVDKITNRLEGLKESWAINYLAMKENGELNTPQGKTQVEAAKLNMKGADDRIPFIEKLLEEERLTLGKEKNPDSKIV